MKTANKWLLAAGLGLALAGGTAIWWPHKTIGHAKSEANKTEAGKNGTAGERVAAPPAVTVARARMANFTEPVLVTGSLVPREEVLVGPEVEGLRIIEVLVEEGDSVRKGQILARLVRDTLDAQMAQNDASLARADAAIAQAKSQIEQADATLKQAQADFDRAKPLRTTGTLTQQTFEQREMLANTSGSKLVAARDGLKLAKADKEVIEAQRRELVWKTGKTEITAPSDGIISRRNARVGQMATGAGEPVFRLISKGEVELEGEVTEARLPKLKAGQTATVEIAGLGTRKGEVRLVSPEVDKTTRLGKVRIFLGADPTLHIGSFARGAVEAAKSRGIAVPASAVLYSADGAYVQTVDNGKVATRSVKTGLASGTLVEVREGLADGTLIIARAGTMVRDGDLVRPMPAAKDTSAGLGGGLSSVE